MSGLTGHGVRTRHGLKSDSAPVDGVPHQEPDIPAWTSSRRASSGAPQAIAGICAPGPRASEHCDPGLAGYPATLPRLLDRGRLRHPATATTTITAGGPGTPALAARHRPGASDFDAQAVRVVMPKPTATASSYDQHDGPRPRSPLPGPVTPAAPIRAVRPLGYLAVILIVVFFFSLDDTATPGMGAGSALAWHWQRSRRCRAGGPAGE